MELSKIFRKYFHKKVLIYTAIGQNQYFQIVDRLSANGVMYWTKTQTEMRGQDYFSEQNRIYDIFVKQEDEGKAIKAMHSKN
jgi:hypothetical protein